MCFVIKNDYLACDVNKIEQNKKNNVFVF